MVETQEKKEATKQGELKIQHKIVKDHSKYTHTTVVEYPHSNVLAMKTSWKNKLNECSEWLEKYDERVEQTLKEGMEKLEKENADALNEIKENQTASEEELFEKFKTKHKEYIETLKQFTNGLDKRKEDFKIAVNAEMNKYKSKIVSDSKQMSEALKLWADK